MAKTESVLEVEIDTPTNGNLIFMPIGGKKVRGRFDWRRVKEPLAAITAARWPAGGIIPGQRIGVDPDTGAAWIVDPLHDSENSLVRERIVGQGLTLPPARQDFPGVHVPTWLHWIKRACEAGLAKIVTGALPAKIEGEPKLSFFGNPTVDPRDAMIDKLIDLVTGLLPAEKRKAVLDKLQG
jgi:hypothetical protein